MKFSALYIIFNGPNLDLLGSTKPVHEVIKKRYPVKVAILPLDQFSVKTVADRHDHATYHNKH